MRKSTVFFMSMYADTFCVVGIDRGGLVLSAETGGKRC